jgi:hypothetical protein
MMGLGAINIDKLDFEGIGKGVQDVASGIGGLFKDLRTAITGKAIVDPNVAKQLEEKMLQIELTLATAQTAINAIEAANPSKFVAGWRPGAGWLCVLGLAWQTFILPVWTWLAALQGLAKPPSIDTSLLTTLLLAMLGLVASRTYEKQQGVQDNH